jgi:signal peptidase I
MDKEPSDRIKNTPLWPGRAMLGAFAVAMVIKIFLFDIMITQGRSMLPVLHPGSVLVVNKAAYGFRIPLAGVYLFRWSQPKAGELVVFYTPLGERAVKRCSGNRKERIYRPGG